MSQCSITFSMQSVMVYLNKKKYLLEKYFSFKKDTGKVALLHVMNLMQIIGKFRAEKLFAHFCHALDVIVSVQI